MSEPSTRPNLVYVFPDQFRKQAMGFLGEDPVVTPRLDAFARESLFLPHAVSNYPVCSPYRAMLMTGQYPARNGVLANCRSDRTAAGNFLKEEARCLTDVLAEAGTSVGYIGKWHLDGPAPDPRSDVPVWDAFTPPGRRRHSVGFWYAYGAAGEHFHPHYWTGDGGEASRIEVDQWSPEHEADQSVAFLRNDGGDFREPGRPFALFVSMNPPHPPYHLVPDRYREAYKGRAAEELLVRPNVRSGPGGSPQALKSVADYFTMVTGVDAQFGRILDTLRAEGLEEDTIVVFTSDHGEMMGSQGLMQKNAIYEESLNVPFLVRWKGTIAPGEDDLLLSTPDISPTLLGLLGLAGRVPVEVQGQDRAPVLLGGKGARPEGALYQVIPVGRPEGGARGLRTHTHTYLAPREGRRGALLFDNEADPYQMTNIAASASGVASTMDEQMRDLLARAQDPWPGP